MIPHNVEIKIHKKYPLDIAPGMVDHDCYKKREGAVFGYSLAQKELEEKDNEILNLKNERIAFDADIRLLGSLVRSKEERIEELEKIIKSWQKEYNSSNNL